MAKENQFSGSGKDFIWKNYSGEDKHQLTHGATRDGMSFIRNMEELKNLPAEAGEAILANVNARIIIDEVNASIPGTVEKSEHLTSLREKYVDKPQTE